MLGAVIDSDVFCGSSGPCLKAKCVAGIVILGLPLLVLDSVVTGWEFDSYLQVKGALKLTCLKSKGVPWSGFKLSTEDGVLYVADEQGTITVSVNRQFAATHDNVYPLLALRPVLENGSATLPSTVKVIHFRLRVQGRHGVLERETEPPLSGPQEPLNEISQRGEQ